MSFAIPKLNISENLEWVSKQPEGIAISTSDYRPCFVDGEKAMFHRWADKSWIVPPSPMVGGYPGGVVRGTYAIVEMDDGTVREVEPEKVKFTTNAELFQRRYLGRWGINDGKG